MKKTITIALMMMLVFMPMIMAKPSWQTNNQLSIGKTDSNTMLETPRKRSSGSSLFTKYGWDGNECVKRDLMRRPRLLIDWETRKVVTDETGNMIYTVSLIDGDKALTWNDKTMKPAKGNYGCTIGTIELDPLPVTWWVHK